MNWICVQNSHKISVVAMIGVGKITDMSLLVCRLQYIRTVITHAPLYTHIPLLFDALVPPGLRADQVTQQYSKVLKQLLVRPPITSNNMSVNMFQLYTNIPSYPFVYLINI